jgi:hypothetical protein
MVSNAIQNNVEPEESNLRANGSEPAAVDPATRLENDRAVIPLLL